MGADGSNPHEITHPNSSSGDSSPAWSPDGQSIAFLRSTSAGTFDLDVADVRGGGLRTLVACASIRCRSKGPQEPAWSPTGDSIVFALDGDIYSVDPAGGQPHVVVSCLARIQLALGTSCAQAHDPVWSPDGTAIAFLVQDGQHSLNVYWTRPDGTRVRRLTLDGRGKCCLAWQPLPHRGSPSR